MHLLCNSRLITEVGGLLATELLAAHRPSGVAGARKSHSGVEKDLVYWTNLSFHAKLGVGTESLIQ